jgi:hypothetical protein
MSKIDTFLTKKYYSQKYCQGILSMLLDRLIMCLYLSMEQNRDVHWGLRMGPNRVQWASRGIA